MMKLPMCSLPSSFISPTKILRKRSPCTSTALVDLFPQEWQFTIQCSMYLAMLLLFALVWQPVWELFLLGAGAKGKRRALPNSRIMIHQPLGGAQGQAADIEIQAKEILFIREVLNTYIAEYCDQPKDKVESDCDRDFFMTPEEAVEYGIIDEVIKTKTSHITKPPMPVL
mmetsp:Transcript_18943/g.24371  ORF Transcript_18943/g.24371 Transcript_18943/m.24371 type:complete len:170 (+) Transcript_18943:419-928(+)